MLWWRRFLRILISRIIRKWTCWVCGTNPSTLGRQRAWSCQIGEAKQTRGLFLSGHAGCVVQIRQLWSKNLRQTMLGWRRFLRILISRIAVIGKPSFSLSILTCETVLISQNVLIKSFFKNKFPHKTVKVFLILVIIKDKLTDLRRESVSIAASLLLLYHSRPRVE